MLKLNYHTIALISHARKVMLKILQARLQQYVNLELTFKLLLEKAEEAEIKLPTSAGSWKKQDCRSNPRSMSALQRKPQVPVPTPHKVLGPGIEGRRIPRGPEQLACELAFSEAPRAGR